MVKYVGILFLCFIFNPFLYAQNPPTAQEVLNQLKTDTRFEDGGADWVQFSEMLLSYEKNPISLNTATQEELAAFPLLNSFQAYHIISYRKKSWGINSYYELLNLKDFSRELITWLMPFTTLEKKNSNVEFKDIFRRANHQFAIRYQRLAQTKKGFGGVSSPFTGDANAVYLRYRLNYKNRIFAGFTLQKDEGEPYLLPGTVYPDYSSYHLEVRNLGAVKTVILGDFYANYGQGLALWSSLSYGKTAETTETQRFAKGLRYYSGADENRFFRGAATSIKIADFSIDFFGSKHKVDATLNNNGLATSLVESGMHRSNTEIGKRKIQSIQTLGAHGQWQQNNFEIGLTGYHYKFGIPIAKKEQAYAIYQFYGSQNFVVSTDFQWIVNKTILYGELAASQSGGSAFIGGFKTSLTDAVTINGLARYLGKDYHTLYNAPFSETGNAGERGVYLGITYDVNSRISIKAYADHFSYEWLRFQVSAPSSGRDYLIHLNYKKEGLLTYLRYRYRAGQFNVSNENSKEIKSGVQQQMRWHGQLRLSSLLKLNTRIEIKTFRLSQVELGYLFYQEIVFGIHNLPLKFYTRVSYFNAPVFTTALYAREDDLPFTYNLALFNNEGVKYYIMAKYQVKTMTFYLRWAHVNYINLEEVGSGNDAIVGNQRSEIKVMFSLRL